MSAWSGAWVVGVASRSYLDCLSGTTAAAAEPSRFHSGGPGSVADWLGQNTVRCSRPPQLDKVV
jgi:hypothetical protein